MVSIFVFMIGLCFYEIIGSSGFIFNQHNGGTGGFGSFSFGGGGGCMPIQRVCPLQCPYGYVKDTHGCDTCRCTSNVQPIQTTPGANLNVITPTNQQRFHIRNPCVAAQSRCSLQCSAFVKGASGCEYCMCDVSQTTSAPGTLATTLISKQVTTPTPAVTTDSDCDVAVQICNDRCNGEYLADPKDCTFCVCKSKLANLGVTE